MEESTQFTMRMENKLYEQLKESAQKNRRSIAKELEHIVDLYINQDVVVTLPKEVASEFLEMAKNWNKDK